MRSERQTDDEAREAVIAVLLRVLDEYRFGVRDLSPEDLVELARAWSIINAGETPAEAALRLGNPARENR